MISGSIVDYNGYNMLGAGINFFVTGSNYDNPTKGIFGFSLSVIPDNLNIFGINAGLLQVLFQDTNFPLSLSAVANFSVMGSIVISPTIGYTQSFFAKKQVYPVVGISYQIPLDQGYYSNNTSTLFVHVGLNIKLDKTTNKKKK